MVLGLHVRLGVIRAVVLTGSWRAPAVLAVETVDLRADESVWPHRSSVGLSVTDAELVLAEARRRARRLAADAVAVALEAAGAAGATVGVAGVVSTGHRSPDLVSSIATRRRAEDADEHLLSTMVAAAARKRGLEVVELSGSETRRRARDDLGLAGRTSKEIAASTARALGTAVVGGYEHAALGAWLALTDYE